MKRVARLFCLLSDVRCSNDLMSATMRRLLITAAFLMVHSVAVGADINGDGHETILLPFAFREHRDVLPGSFGTRWTGQVWLENRNDAEVPLFQYCMQLCPGFGAHLTGRMGTDPLGINPAEQGLLLFIPIGLAGNLTFSNRIFETTLRAQPRGVDIPVVREGNFFTGTQTLIGVPGGPAVRISLRAYDPWQAFTPPALPGPPLEQVHVVVLDEHQRMELGTATLQPRVMHRTTVGQDWHKPGFDALYDLAAVIPAINDHQYVHVRLHPVPAGAQYWAMVAVTDNETQTVSIITAQ